MAYDQDYPANADVIQGARAIRSNPALFAALMSPPTAAPASADPNVGLSPPARQPAVCAPEFPRPGDCDGVGSNSDATDPPD
jgi:hypothetical protein